MFQNLIKDLFNGLVRHGATALGMFLISHGYMADNQMNDLLGSCFMLAGIGWNVYTQFSNQKKLVVAAATGDPNPATNKEKVT